MKLQARRHKEKAPLNVLGSQKANPVRARAPSPPPHILALMVIALTHIMAAARLAIGGFAMTQSAGMVSADARFSPLRVQVDIRQQGVQQTPKVVVARHVPAGSHGYANMMVMVCTMTVSKDAILSPRRVLFRTRA